MDVVVLRIANRRSKYSTAFPKEGRLTPRNPSGKSAALAMSFHRNSCNKIRKWILQLLDEKYQRRLQCAAYYSDTVLRSPWHSIRFRTRNANRPCHPLANWYTARWTSEINAENSSVDQRRSVDILVMEQYCESSTWKICPFRRAKMSQIYTYNQNSFHEFKLWIVFLTRRRSTGSEL